MDHENIIDDLLDDLKPLRFDAPVTHVYNPLVYARKPYSQYCEQYGTPVKEIVLVGMNPGPWGMAQTGIPFGEITAVKEWLHIQAPVGQPADLHPRRPVTGFGCTRSEVSGKRLWGWAQATFKTPEDFFSRFFVTNYCPLQFLESSGRNRTPNQLPKQEKAGLLAACDRALRRTVEHLKPRYVIGVGKFAHDRARTAVSDPAITVGSISHPSPANPKANRGWEALIRKEFQAMGIEL
jgi:single-strand selective monofunctional uracil DNA glycosylase